MANNSAIDNIEGPLFLFRHEQQSSEAVAVLVVIAARVTQCFCCSTVFPLTTLDACAYKYL